MTEVLMPIVVFLIAVLSAAYLFIYVCFRLFPGLRKEAKGLVTVFVFSGALVGGLLAFDILFGPWGVLNR